MNALIITRERRYRKSKGDRYATKETGFKETFFDRGGLVAEVLVNPRIYKQKKDLIH